MTTSSSGLTLRQLLRITVPTEWLSGYLKPNGNFDDELRQAVRQAYWQLELGNVRSRLLASKQQCIRILQRAADFGDNAGKYDGEIKTIRSAKTAPECLSHIQSLAEKLLDTDELFAVIKPHIDQYETLLKQRKVATVFSAVPVEQEVETEGRFQLSIPTKGEINQAIDETLGEDKVRRRKNIQKADIDAAEGLFQDVQKHVNEWQARAKTLIEIEVERKKWRSLCKDVRGAERHLLDLMSEFSEIDIRLYAGTKGIRLDLIKKAGGKEVLESRGEELRELIPQAKEELKRLQKEMDEERKRRIKTYVAEDSPALPRRDGDEEASRPKAERKRKVHDSSPEPHESNPPVRSSSADPPEKSSSVSTPSYSGGYGYSGSSSASNTSATSSASAATPKSTGADSNLSADFLSGILTAIGGLICFNFLFPSKKPAPKSSEPKGKFAMDGDKDTQVAVGVINHSKRRTQSFVEQTNSR